jgi:hypothetical protein
MCALAIQQQWRHHRWLETRAPMTVDLAPAYRERQYSHQFGLASLLGKIDDFRSRHRLPLTEAFYNGELHVIRSCRRGSFCEQKKECARPAVGLWHDS